MSDFDAARRKVERANRLFMGSMAGLIALILLITVWWLISELRTVKDQLIRAQNQHKQTTVDNLNLNRAQVCILSIPATTRTQTQIDKCLTDHTVDTRDIKLP